MTDEPGCDRKKVRYFSYLLRLWRESGANNNWRASLERADTSSRIGFPSLETLFEYLRQKTAGWASGAGTESEKEVTKKAE